MTKAKRKKPRPLLTLLVVLTIALPKPAPALVGTVVRSLTEQVQTNLGHSHLVHVQGQPRSKSAPAVVQRTPVRPANLRPANNGYGRLPTPPARYASIPPARGSNIGLGGGYDLAPVAPRVASLPGYGAVPRDTRNYDALPPRYGAAPPARGTYDLAPVAPVGSSTVGSAPSNYGRLPLAPASRATNPVASPTGATYQQLPLRPAPYDAAPPHRGNSGVGNYQRLPLRPAPYDAAPPGGRIAAAAPPPVAAARLGFFQRLKARFRRNR